MHFKGSLSHMLDRILQKTKLKKPKKKRKEVFITGLNSGLKNLPHRALLYFKTDPFVCPDLVNKYKHPNVWEVTEIVAILNRFGFEVDLIDRSADDFLPDDVYELFVGLGSGGSGRHFGKYAKRLPRAVKILYATARNPLHGDQLTKERYQRFAERTKIQATPMRLRSEINIDEFARCSDYIFCYGEKSSFSYQSYERYGKPMFSIMQGISPKVRFSPAWLNTRKRNRFICFSGDGFIWKGVDLVVEAFLKVPECDLVICGPDSDKAFFDAYGKAIAESPNIRYEGFLDVGGERFEELCAQCSFVIFCGFSEGCATSVTTMLGAGMVPVLSAGTGVNVGEFGFSIVGEEDSIMIDDMVKTVRNVSTMDHDEYVWRVLRTLEDSSKYTQASLTQSFSKALLSVMREQIPFWH